MIPIGLPSIEWLLCVLALLGATLAWCGWSLGLVFSRAWRGRLRGARLGIYLALGLAAAFTLYHIAALQWQLQAHQREHQFHYQPVLQTPQRLGGIDMPAGTQLELHIADWRESFQLAVFPAPQLVAGVQTTRIERYVTVDYDSAYQPVRTQADNMRLQGHGVSLQQGWRCDAAHPVEFKLQANGYSTAFARCVLAPGNAVAGIALPAGAALRASSGNVYIDAFVDSDRWVLDIDGAAEITIDGLVLSEPVLALDAQRKIYTIDRATLAHGVQWGGLHYPPGTTAQWNPRHLRANYPRAWLLQAPAPQAGAVGGSAVHDRSGNLLKVLPGG